MNRRSRLVLWLGTLLFVGVALWWCVWFPFAPDRVRGAIPPHAVMVGEHAYLLDRAQALLQTPALRQSIHVLGGDTADLDAFFTSREGRWLGECLAGRYTVTAFAPQSSSDRASAWMVSSWGGVRAQLLRWMLDGGLIKGWERLPDPSPVRCYRFTGVSDGLFFSAAIYEGVVLFCWSSDPAAVTGLVRRLTYGTPSSPLLTSAIPDRDRVQLCWLPGTDAPRSVYGWSLPSTNQVGIRFTLPARMPLPVVRAPRYTGEMWSLIPGVALPSVDTQVGVQMEEAEWSMLRAGLGALSGAIILAPTAVCDGVLRSGGSSEMAVLYRQTIRPRIAQDGLVALALLHDGYSGRLLGIKTPSLVLAVKMAPDWDLGRELPGMLDAWNARLGVSLMARDRSGEGASLQLFIIDEARNGIYSSMKAREKPALWQSGEWLFVASNLASGLKVHQVMRAPAGSAQHVWWNDVHAAPDAIHVWVDFKAAGTAVRKLAALNAIIQIAQGRRSGPAVKLMERTGLVVSALQPFGEGHLTVDVTPDDWAGRLILGK